MLENAMELITKGVFPDQFVFKLNNDKKTYSADCTFNHINVNGEDKSVTFHSDKTSFPKFDSFMSTNEDNNALFDIIIPDKE